MQSVSLCTITVCETMLVFALSDPIQLLLHIIPQVEGSIYFSLRGELFFWVALAFGLSSGPCDLISVHQMPTTFSFLLFWQCIARCMCNVFLYWAHLRQSGKAKGNVMLWLKIRSGSRCYNGGIYKPSLLCPRAIHFAIRVD